jgi:membrane peptidoglycan carboxypeptidase
VLTKGTASGTGGLAGGRPAAGKTGTTDNSAQSWFIGYTPQLTTAVWVGTPDNQNNTRSMQNLQLGNTFYSGPIFGATIAAPIWKQIMDRASVGMPFLDFAAPSSQVQIGDFVPIPSVAGMTVGDATTALTAAGFKPVVGNAVNSLMPTGQVVGTQPAGQALRGSQVVILTSTGYVPPPPVIAPPPAAKTPVAPKPRAGVKAPKKGG